MQAEIRRMLPVYSRHSKESLAKSYNIKNKPVKQFHHIQYQSESALNISQNESKPIDESEEGETPPRSSQILNIKTTSGKSFADSSEKKRAPKRRLLIKANKRQGKPKNAASTIREESEKGSDMESRMTPVIPQSLESLNRTQSMMSPGLQDRSQFRKTQNTEVGSKSFRKTKQSEVSYAESYEKKQVKTLKHDSEPQKRLHKQHSPQKQSFTPMKEDMNFPILSRPKRKMKKSFTNRGSSLQLSARKLVHNTFL